MSSTLSDVYEATAPTLVGVWVFDPLDPVGTERHYPHADGRTITAKPDTSVIDVVGRLNPLLEFGDSTTLGLKMTVTVPFGPTHDADVEWWYTAMENRRAICYRDNRGRLYWVGLPSGINPVDGRIGTAFALDLLRLDFDESVA